MEAQKSKYIAALFLSMMGVICISMPGASATDFCDAITCMNLDACQSVADSLCVGLVNYKSSQDISTYQLSNNVSDAVSLYAMTSRYLNVFKGLGSALATYMTSTSYKTESSNQNVSTFTNQTKYNLTLVISHTSQAVDDMAWTLYGNDPVAPPPVVISPTKTAIFGLGYRVSDNFRVMLKNWRQGCK